MTARVGRRTPDREALPPVAWRKRVRLAAKVMLLGFTAAVWFAYLIMFWAMQRG